MGRAFMKPGVEGKERRREVLRLTMRKGGPLTLAQLNYCDEACIDRFLKAKGNDLRRAAKHLRATLCWRQLFDVDNLTADEFQPELTAGHAYVAGQDQEGRAVMVVRLKPEHIVSNQAQNQFIRYFVFTMEVAVSYMPKSVEECILIMDMGFLKKGAPGFSMMVQLLKILADHYPERLAKTFVVDAPPMFYYLWKGMGGFLSRGMKEKLRFVYSKHYTNKSREEAGHSRRVPSSYDKWAAEHIEASNEQGDKFDFHRTASWISNMQSVAAPSVFNCPSFRMSSSSSSSTATSSSSSSMPHMALVHDKDQARSFSFATGCISNEPKASASVEFRSFRTADSKCADLQDIEDGYSSRRWADLPFSSLSMTEAESSLHLHQDTERGLERKDIFLLHYLTFYLSPYNEAAYRSKMRVPLGGLISILSSDLKASRQHSFSLLRGPGMELEPPYVTFG